VPANRPAKTRYAPPPTPVQPVTRLHAPLPEEQAKAVEHAIGLHGQRPGGLLELLHCVQHELGYIPPAAIPRIAEALTLSRAEVHGVITYYPHFYTAPRGRHVVQICQAEACQSRGAKALMEHAKHILGCGAHETSADGAVTIEPVYCLGLCACSPAVMVDEHELHTNVTPRQLQALIGQCRQPGVSPSPADQPAGRADLPTGEGWGRGQEGMPQGANAPSPALRAPSLINGRGTIRLYVPRDSAALAAGADAVATAFQRECAARGHAVEIIRNGSRGMLWLEPLVEVETAEGRVAYGPVSAAQVPELLDAGLLEARPHALCHGLTEAIPYLAKQERLTFARVGVIDPLNLDDYAAHGGWQGLRNAAAMSGADVVQQVLDSGLRGRGGAAFPAGIKWKTVLQATSAQKYIACNADEGDSGTFADRMLMEGDPYCLIEGMAIAGLAVGATHGFIYVRSEYPHAINTLNEAIARATAAGFLGDNVVGSGQAFHLEVRKGAGSYVCGEETAMLESIEGRRGIVRAKPPIPALEGLWGKPTIINNVITLASVPTILARGAEFYQSFGMGRSRGTLPFQLAGNLRHGGLVEKAFGVSLKELMEDFGGGTATGRPIKAVQVGGPLGTYVAPKDWNTPLDYEAMAASGNMVGHGGIVVHDDTADMAQLARFAMEFCVIESCGKCTPCRIGSTRGVEVIDRVIQGGPDHAEQVALLHSLCGIMVNGSMCAMGNMTPLPVKSALEHYPQDFGIAETETATV